MGERSRDVANSPPADDPDRRREVAAIAHDIGNALSLLVARLSVLVDDPRAAAVREELREGLNDVDRARSLLRLLQRRPDRRGSQQASLLDSWTSASAGLDMGRSTVRIAESAREPLVAADTTELRTILASIIGTETASLQRAGLPVVGTLSIDRSDGRLRLEVETEAPPLSPGDVATLMDPFFVRKPAEFGSGIGFGLCARIASSRGGDFRIADRDGRRVYVLELPAASGSVPAPSIDTRPKTILVIDDDPMVRESYRLMLARLGASIEAVATGEEGLARLATASFDAVILDLHLGKGLPGGEVVRWIEETRSGMLARTIIATGDPHAGEAHDVAERFGLKILGKPFGLDELRRVISL
jgi:CheY-like chemotaxis protein